ncbi:RlpA-like double-psi beta-barrel-protein domain-containing protein-containing protein [Biscogniauxia sp. FL1348]|nr:RlpA-like double-psi beta-barrel-protein domain-containing protein-containing protein [Biscogniauxia sp. FL1348]
MADHHQQQTQPIPPVFQLPDWEIPTPKPPKPPTLMNRVSNSFKTVSQSLAGANKDHATELEEGTGNGCAKETSAESSTLPTHRKRQRKPIIAPAIASFRSRFDASFPPHRTYLGHTRRFMLRYVVLPLAVFIFVVIPLVIGLGVGLSRPKASQNLPLPGNGGAVYTGDLTYYDPSLGACGMSSNSGELVGAVSHLVFDAAASGSGSNPNQNPLCGMKIRVQRDFVEAGVGNQSVDVTVVDRCEDCAATDIDLSIAAFAQLALQESGRVRANWTWLA